MGITATAPDVVVKPQTVAADVAREGEGLDRSIGFLACLWASVGLDHRLGVAVRRVDRGDRRGPSALIAWMIASFIVILLALVHAELGGLFPVSGGTSRFPHYAFGSLAGMTFGWASYLQAATTAPIEVLAVIQYLSTAHWAHGFYRPGGTLSPDGIVAAVILMAGFVVLNLIGIRWLTRANTAITTWKVSVPVLTIIVLLATHFHGNFTAGGGFFVHGCRVQVRS